MFTSIREYTTSLGRWGWVVLIELVGSGIAIWLDFKPDPPPDVTNFEQIRGWFWVGLLLVGLTIPPFLAFHKVRKERDQALDEIKTARVERPTVRASIHRLDVGASDDGKNWFKPDKSLGKHQNYVVVAQVAIFCEVKTTVEAVQLLFRGKFLDRRGDREFLPQGTVFEDAFTADFDLPAGIKKGTYTVKVRIHAHADTWDSGPAELVIPF